MLLKAARAHTKGTAGSNRGESRLSAAYIQLKADSALLQLHPRRGDAAAQLK